MDANLGAFYSDRRHHGYTFNVDQDKVTATRSFYRASSGYTGLRFSLGTRWRMGDLVWGANFRYYNFSDSVNSDSDLLRKEDYASLSFVIVWIFKESTDQAAQ